MNHYPKSVQELIASLSRLPGIGAKTAERLAMYILRASPQESQQLAQRIVQVKQKTRLCRHCFAMSDGETCTICEDPSRNDGRLCVVEQPADMISIEKSGVWKGRYHILQGALSPIDGIGPDALRIRELLARIADGQVNEVVLATGTSVEGETTAVYLAEKLKAFPAVRVSRIATGVPVGGDLKYVDPMTLRKALESRHGL
jgi:recombination protein RecR